MCHAATAGPNTGIPARLDRIKPNLNSSLIQAHVCNFVLVFCLTMLIKTSRCHFCIISCVTIHLTAAPVRMLCTEYGTLLLLLLFVLLHYHDLSNYNKSRCFITIHKDCTCLQCRRNLLMSFA